MLRNLVCKVFSPLPKVSRHSFLTSHLRLNVRAFSEEFSFGVGSEDDDYDINDFRNYYITEDVRQEIYQDHKEDPKKWTVNKIAMEYGMSLDRAKAIIYLMKSREEYIEKSGICDATPQWFEIFDKFTADPSDGILERLATEYEMTAAEIKRIVDILDDITFRQQTLIDSSAYYEEHLALMEQLGANIDFAEVENSQKHKQRFQQNYYPQLLKDEQFEEEKIRLRERLLKETKADPIITPNTYAVFIAAQLKNAPDLPEAPNKSCVDVTPSRWKFAFRDLSFKERKDKRYTKEVQHPPPTMIRTRDGGWRRATALEEMQCSWSTRPRHLEMQRGKHKWEPLLDPDGDEASSKERAKAIKSKRRNVLKNAQLNYSH